VTTIRRPVTAYIWVEAASDAAGSLTICAAGGRGSWVGRRHSTRVPGIRDYLRVARQSRTTDIGNLTISSRALLTRNLWPSAADAYWLPWTCRSSNSTGVRHDFLLASFLPQY
jgi:hypothetical protein